MVGVQVAPERMARVAGSFCQLWGSIQAESCRWRTGRGGLQAKRDCKPTSAPNPDSLGLSSFTASPMRSETAPGSQRDRPGGPSLRAVHEPMSKIITAGFFTLVAFLSPIRAGISGPGLNLTQEIGARMILPCRDLSRMEIRSRV